MADSGWSLRYPDAKNLQVSGPYEGQLVTGSNVAAQLRRHGVLNRSRMR